MVNHTIVQTILVLLLSLSRSQAGLAEPIVSVPLDRIDIGDYFSKLQLPSVVVSRVLFQQVHESTAKG